MMRVHNGWNGTNAEITDWMLNQYARSLKAPSPVVLLELSGAGQPGVGRYLGSSVRRLCNIITRLPRLKKALPQCAWLTDDM